MLMHAFTPRKRKKMVRERQREGGRLEWRGNREPGKVPGGENHTDPSLPLTPGGQATTTDTVFGDFGPVQV